MGPIESSHDQLAEQLVALAMRSGAEAAEVFQSFSASRPVFFEANRLKQLESSQVEGTALRIWRDRKPGIAVAYGSVEPQALVERAIALSELNEPEEIELTENLQITYPAQGQDVAVEQLVDWGREAIAQVRDAYPEVLCSAELECDMERTRIISSAGLDCSHVDTTLSFYLDTEWVRGDDFLNVSDGQTRRESLDPTMLVQQILQRLEWAEDNVAPPQGRPPVLFTAKAADMIWGTVLAALSGKRVIERSSPWSDSLEEAVTDAKLTLFQDPEAGPFSCPFDDEGTPTQRLTFIQDGVLKLFYTDRTIGRVLGGGSTGNGFRPGLGSYPTPSIYNCIIQPGVRSLNELIASLDDAIVVDQMLGGGAGISGDFSINVDLGYRIRNGEITGRVKDTMVAGNVYTVIKQLMELGGDADWNGSCYTPSVILGGLSTTGRSI